MPTRKMHATTSCSAPTLVSFGELEDNQQVETDLTHVLTAGHGGGYKTPKCSELKLDAITTDDAGKSYLFAGKLEIPLLISVYAKLS